MHPIPSSLAITPVTLLLRARKALSRPIWAYSSRLWPLHSKIIRTLHGKPLGQRFEKNMLLSMRPSIRATTERRTAAPRMGGMGQRVYKPLLGVADTNHLLSIHIWVMLGNA